MSTQELHSRSVYLETPRPEVLRQRSYSLPLGLISINAEEAGILFSAAQKATARRRRIVSVDNTTWMDGPGSHSEPTPPLSASTIRPTPHARFSGFSGVHVPESKPVLVDIHRTTRKRAQTHMDRSQTSPVKSVSPISILQSLPSSPKRQVPHSLKNYADGLFHFTQARLGSTIPQIQSTLGALSPTQVPDLSFDDEPVSEQLNRFPRPGLQSHFSDWSIATGAESSRDHSRRSSVVTPPEVDYPLMSPDSFFGGGQSMPKLAHAETGIVETCASSPTYNPFAAALLTKTPDRPLHAHEEEDISYFSNFQYFNRDSNEIPTDIPQQQPERLVIDLSPLEVPHRAPAAPAPQRRRAETVVRADTAVRAPSIARTCSIDVCAPSSRSRSVSRGRSSPATPLERAMLTAEAVRIPRWLVGSIR